MTTVPIMAIPVPPSQYVQNPVPVQVLPPPVLPLPALPIAQVISPEHEEMAGAELLQNMTEEELQRSFEEDYEKEGFPDLTFQF